MTTRFLSLLFVAFLVGCSGKADPPKKEQPPAKQADSGTKDTTPKQQDDQPPEAGEYTHVIKFDTEYYVTGPQQGRPPEGTLKAGTKVKVLEEAPAYSQVRSEDGVEAFVATGSFEPLAIE